MPIQSLRSQNLQRVLDRLAQGRGPTLHSHVVINRLAAAAGVRSEAVVAALWAAVPAGSARAPARDGLGARHRATGRHLISDREIARLRLALVRQGAITDPTLLRLAKGLDAELAVRRRAAHDMGHWLQEQAHASHGLTRAAHSVHKHMLTPLGTAVATAGLETTYALTRPIAAAYRALRGGTKRLADVRISVSDQRTVRHAEQATLFRRAQRLAPDNAVSREAVKAFIKSRQQEKAAQSRRLEARWRRVVERLDT